MLWSQEEIPLIDPHHIYHELLPPSLPEYFPIYPSNRLAFLFTGMLVVVTVITT
jgi:hypothetical protein